MPELTDKYDEFTAAVDKLRSEAIGSGEIICHPKIAAEFVAYCDENGYERPEITVHDASEVCSGSKNR